MRRKLIGIQCESVTKVVLEIVSIPGIGQEHWNIGTGILFCSGTVLIIWRGVRTPFPGVIEDKASACTIPFLIVFDMEYQAIRLRNRKHVRFISWVDMVKI